MTADEGSERTHAAPRAAIPHYEIRVEGHLGPRWSAWFDGLTITTEPDGSSVITGPVIDQSALHGLLQKLRDVGVPLLSLTQLPSQSTQHTNEGN